MMNKRSRKHKKTIGKSQNANECGPLVSETILCLNVFIYDFLHDRQVFLKSAISLMTFDFL